MKRKSMTGAAAIVWGASMLIVGLVNLRFPSYGADFLRTMSSLYPGFHDTRTFGDVLIGTLYGIVDGAVVGFVFSSLYRWMGRPGLPEASRLAPTTAADPTLLRRAS